MIHTPAIEHDVVYASFTPTFESLDERVEAAYASLVHLGTDVEVTDDDADLAREIFASGAKVTPDMLSSPGAVIHLKSILSEYDKQVVESAAQLRTYVTNKLVIESTDRDPRVRLKALELLGKISDVGLFSEKTEITLRHRPTEELEQMLRDRLERVIGGHDASVNLYAATPEEDPAGPLVLNLDDEFGE